MLNLQRLRVLREVVARGSLTAAAQALSFSQPAISSQIAKLEEETGARLLERIPRGVRPTEAGQLLVRHADAILGRLALAEAELAELLDVRRGSLRLGAFPSAWIDLVARALARFDEQHPEVEVTLREVNADEGLVGLDEGELDLVVSFAYSIAPVPAADAHGRTELLDDPMYVLLGRDHPLAGRAGITLADLREEPWVQFTRGPASHELFRAFAAAGYEPRTVLETDDLSAIQGLVAAGVGLTLVPGMALPVLRPGLVARSLGGELPARRVHAMWPAAGRTPAAAAMVPILEDEGRRLHARLERGLGEAGEPGAGPRANA